MTRIFAVRANAFDYTSGTITTVSGVYDSDVWDGQKWDVLGGHIMAGGSGDVWVRQGGVSGTWDITDIIHCQSGVAQRVAIPLQGRYVQLHWVGLSGSAALKAFRGQLWGKLADNEARIMGWNRGSSDYRYVAVNASGEIAVTVTTASVSGNIVIAKVSGETVTVLSTVAKVSGETLVVPSTSVSGNIIIGKISGETVVVLSTSVSGNAVSVSGNILSVPLTSVSGNAVSASGNIISVPLTSVSGNAVSCSGNIMSVPLTSVSGNAVSVSGNMVTAATSVSGNIINATTSVSGDIIVAKVSGETVVVLSTSVSGNAVSVSGNLVAATTSVSGNIVNATTSVSGNIVIGKVSGEIVNIARPLTGYAHIATVVGSSSVNVLSGNANRRYALLVNDSLATIWVTMSATAAVDTGVRLNANGGYYEMAGEMGNLYTGQINAIMATGSGTLLATEGT